MEIEWRIVSLTEAQRTAQTIPFTTMTGIVESIDAFTANNQPKSDLVVVATTSSSDLSKYQIAQERAS